MTNRHETGREDPEVDHHGETPMTTCDAIALLACLTIVGLVITLILVL